MKATTSLTRKLLVPAILIFAGVYACSAQRTTAVSKGQWGAAGVVMDVTDAGASLDFDCANGTITKQLRVKRDGSFTAEGTWMRNGPGPIRADAQGRAVTFKGKVKGKTMTLHITDAKTDETIADYTLVHGASVRLHHCY
ncbi:MAG: hypothetical protein ACJ73D_07500 [Pyrinomonadaceae bacterium]